MFFNKKTPTANEFSALFANSTLTGQLTLKVGTQAAMNNFQMQGDILAEAGVTIHTENTILELGRLNSVSGLVVGKDSTVAVKGTTAESDITELDRLVIEKGGHIHINGTLNVLQLVIKNGGTLDATNVYCASLTLEPGANLSAKISTNGVPKPEVVTAHWLLNNNK